MASPQTSDISRELFPFLRLYKDGRVERIHNPHFVPPSVDHKTGVSSKDIIVIPETGVSVRLFLPPNTAPGQKLPILVYFHGGGFCIESAFAAGYHRLLNTLVSESRAIGVSVDYRLAPEHPVPTAHRDSWLALEWVARQSGAAGTDAEPWLAGHGDFNRIFLAGDSAGGNIAHHMSMAASGHAPLFEDLLRVNNAPVEISGIILTQPYFAGWPQTTNDEKLSSSREESAALWAVTCPSATNGTDHPLVNLESPESPDFAILKCRRAIVFVSGKDYLQDRGCLYYELLKKNGWKGDVEIVRHEDEDHVFHILKPDSENAKHLIKLISNFINK